MPVKAAFDNSGCWQVEGEPVLDWTGEKVMGTTLDPRDADPTHKHNYPYASIPFDTYEGCSRSQMKNIKQAWRDIVTILAKIPAFKSGNYLEQRNFGTDIAERISDVNFINGAPGTIGGYAFDDAQGSPGGSIVFCGGIFAPGQEYLAAVQKELDADRTKQKDSISNWLISSDDS
ncbi:oviduct-specific glycoprotein [Fusarium bulbicola]|nr:oviduct-specific glycoprotein [Fusarium bulbicola]